MRGLRPGRSGVATLGGSLLLLTIGALAHAATCEVRPVGGVPTFVVNGRPHSGFAYATYDTNPERLGRRAAAFAAAGCDIFNFVVEISGYGYSPPMWVSRDQWDFRELDARAHTILSNAPEAYLLPRLYVDAPLWWMAENPGELMVLENGATDFGAKLYALPRSGPYPSLASRRWREDMKHALRTVIAHVQASDYGDRVIGYQLSGQKTEEWYHWSMNAPLLGDYSAPMVGAFRQWLRGKYRTDAALRRAWHDPSVTLATAAIPSAAARRGQRSSTALGTELGSNLQGEGLGVRSTFRDPLREAPVIDFHDFWSDIMADTIADLAGAVKAATHRRQVVGAFYGYTFEFTELAEDAGHLAVDKLERCPDLDFLMAPSSYFNRNLPGQPYFRAPVQSLARHGKLFWNDFDQVSYKYYEKLQDDPNLKNWESTMGLTQTPEEFVWMCRRELGMTLAQGVQTAHFDIHGGYYDDPEIMAGVKRLGEIRRQVLAQPNRGSTAQILLLMDEPSEHYLTFRNPLLTTLLSAQVAEMPFVAPYDTALLADLEVLDLSRYRLVLVLNAFRLDRAQRAAIRRRLQTDGRTIVWCYGAGYLDESGADAAHIRSLAGITVRADPTPHEATEAVAGRDRLRVPAGVRFTVTDPQAEALASLTEGTAVVVARRRLAGWTSVYAGAAPLPRTLLKRLARQAGVHIYDSSTRHLLFAHAHTLTIGADRRGGPATIRLPQARTVTDLFTGEVVCRDQKHFTLALRPAEVRMLGIE